MPCYSRRGENPQSRVYPDGMFMVLSLHITINVNIMKKIILTAAGALITLLAPAQVNKKDTMRVDTAHIEKIRKMPMDSIPGKMPTKKTPEDVPQKGKKEQPIRKEG
jgi:hypothetical protein